MTPQKKKMRYLILNDDGKLPPKVVLLAAFYATLIVAAIGLGVHMIKGW